MTPIGHALTGLAIGAAVVPRRLSSTAKVAALIVYAILANLPDLPLPGWGHDRYDVSHSLPLTLALCATACLVGVVIRKPPLGSIALLLGGAAAWLSHLLLDTFYNHGKGLAMFWPFSDLRIALPIEWLSTMTLSPMIGWHNIRVFTIEANCFGAILLGAIALRRLAESQWRR